MLAIAEKLCLRLKDFFRSDCFIFLTTNFFIEIKSKLKIVDFYSN